MDGRILYATRLLRKKIKHHWSVAELANLTGLSVSRFHGLFKSEVGIAPKSYLHNLRLELSKELLESTFLQIKEISWAVGISDASRYTREFRRNYGESPTTYRRDHWKQQTNISNGTSRIGAEIDSFRYDNLVEVGEELGTIE